MHNILLVEDNKGDVLLMEEAFRKSATPCRLWSVPNGAEALAFVRHEGRYADAPRPDLILLDLEMPKKDGREVLAEIKADAGLAAIPIIVLTYSADEREKNLAAIHKADAFMTKPFEFGDMIAMVKGIHDRWLGP